MKNKEIARFKIMAHVDREAVVIGLANSGYNVRVESKYEGTLTMGNSYWVVVESPWEA